MLFFAILFESTVSISFFLICDLTLFYFQSILVCIFSTIASQERHTREHQHHQHHRHHNIQQRQQPNLINLENVHGNKTFGGHAWLSSPETAENELEKRGKNGWSAWTNWSTCSRSCDGGIAQQIRRCHSTHCRGEPIRYRICNMQVNLIFTVIYTGKNQRQKFILRRFVF